MGRHRGGSFLFWPRGYHWGMNTSITLQAVRNAIAAAVYVFAVTMVMQRVASLFADKPSIFAPMAALLLFMVSALITGSLILWKPAQLLVGGQKREAGIYLCVAGSTLVAVLAIVVLVLALR